MSLEQKINYQLNKYPAVKKVIKRAYQTGMYAISKKTKSEGNITRISPNDTEHEYFFGYYDKSPWDITDRYMLCMRANNTWSDVSPRETADILIIDTEKEEDDPKRTKKIAETKAWNVQQACMLQWLGPDFSSKILYNDYRNGQYCAVILTLATMEERVISMPVYTVSNDGKTALTLDFSRLYNLRPGYGYYNVPEKTKDIGLPDATAVWKIDLETGEVTELLNYIDFANFQPRHEMQEKGSVHKVNHLMLSPNGKRFMVLYRWFNGQRKYTRLITCNVDGTDMYVLSDDDMVSHCYWKNNSSILAFENKKKTGPGYYLMKDKTQNYIHCWPQFSNDGHPSYSPDGSLIVTDSYPDRARVASINIMDGNERKRENTTIAKVFAPFKYDNDTRCDLHPRWNHKGDKICFDSVFEGHRGLYVVGISPVNSDRHAVLVGENSDSEVEGMVSCIIPSYKRCNTVIRAIDSVLGQTYKSVEVLIVDDNTPNDEYSIALQEALKKYDNEPRVRYIQQKLHKNGAVARNVGIQEANGEFVAFLDDDDEWLPEKIEKQMKLIDKNKELDAVTCLWSMWEKGQEFRKCPHYTADSLQFKVLLREVAVFTSTLLIRRKSVLRFGGFDETLLRHQDLQFLVDATDVSKFAVLNEYLVKLHTDSEINRPNVEKLISAKEAFFVAIDSELKKYSKAEQRRIKNAHKYEVVFSALKSRKIGTAINYGLKAGFNPKSINDLYLRFKGR